jgi:Spy/CpxP family protein refolding chaperone
MKAVAGWLTAVVLFGAAVARGQGPPPPGGRPIFLDQLFVPEQVMRYQTEIALTDEQRAAITQAMGDAQKKLVDLQWQFESSSKKLSDTLAAPTIDEAAALAQAEQVMNLELQMKKANLALLMRIKNVLTAAQQAKLRELRGKEPGRPGPPPFGH